MVDFDYWVELFKNDPSEFIRQKNALLEQKAAELYGADSDKAQRTMSVVLTTDMKLLHVKDPSTRQAILEVMFNEQVSQFNTQIKEGFTSIKAKLSDMLETLDEEKTQRKPPVDFIG